MLATGILDETPPKKLFWAPFFPVPSFFFTLGAIGRISADTRVALEWN